MTILVDSNIILDVLTDDPHWAAWSKSALEEISERNRLVINQIIFAELSSRYETTAALDLAVPPDRFVREQIPFEAAFLAGKAFVLYRRRGGIRTSPLPDFFIGAHAAVSGYRLLTRDAARYRGYFPNLALITP